MKALRRLFLVFALAFCAAPVLLSADGAQAADKTVTPPASYPERVMGNPDAPITLYEYSSLTCPHCREFHEKTLPELKKTYIDTGRVKLVFRDFPLDQLAMAAGMMARCAPEPMFYKIIEALYHHQPDWSRSQSPLDALKQYGRLAGMNDQAMDACFKNEALFKDMQNVQTQAQSVHGINSTPSFVLNGKTHSGAQSAAYFADLIEDAEKAAKK